MRMSNLVRSAFMLLLLVDFAQATVITGGWKVIDDQMADDSLGTFANVGFSNSTDLSTNSELHQFDGQSRFAYPGDGSSIATWTFLDLPSGYYNIAASYAEGTNRPTNAPYSIVGGPTIPVDQTAAATGIPSLADSFPTNIPFEMLVSEYFHAGGNLVITLNNNTGGFPIADAIAVQSVPEPSAACLLGIGGILGCHWLRRRLSLGLQTTGR